MKKQISFLFVLALVLAIPFSSCKKDEADPPTVTTATVTSISETSVTCGGEVTAKGSSEVTARGVCWSTTANPTIGDSKTSDGTGTGVFVSAITGLTPGTIYHVRAYATNGDGTNYGADVTFTTASLIKTIGVVYPDGVEEYVFTYDANNRITKIDDYWNDELDKTIVYDWSVAGKLSITSGSNDPTVYDINANYMVTKEWWSADEWAAYEYDANGYLIKVIEHWGGEDHLKMMGEITDGNYIRHTTYDDDGTTVKKIKEFFYTIGDNTNAIYQTSMIDSNTKPMGNLFGKPSAKLVSYLEYWDPRETPIEKGRTDIAYDFDTNDRPTTITRTGDGWQEVYTYDYY